MSQKLPNMLENTIQKIREMVDVNSVIGQPITTPDGVTIIPVSKISVGYASGGLDSKKIEEKKMFAGGGGTGLTVQPVCFLAVHADGNVEMLPLGGSGAAPDTVDKIANAIEKAPDIISKLKALFSKKKKKSDAEADCDDPVDTVAAAAADVAADAMEKKAD